MTPSTQPVERQAEERLRHRQQHDALRPLHHADLRVDAQRLGARPRVRREERADEPEQADDDHRHAALSGARFSA